MLISWRQGIQHSLHRGPRLDHDPPFGIRTVIATRGSEGSGRALPSLPVSLPRKSASPLRRVQFRPAKTSGPPQFFQALDRRLIPLVSSRAFFFFFFPACAISRTLQCQDLDSSVPLTTRLYNAEGLIARCAPSLFLLRCILVLMVLAWRPAPDILLRNNIRSLPAPPAFLNDNCKPVAEPTNGRPGF